MKSSSARLRVSPSRRHLESEDGSPFFYLGDTAWELLHRLTLPEAEAYLEKRARQGFRVVQTVALAELDGLRVPAACGEVPFRDCDPRQPVEAYWQLVDAVIAHANALGLYVGLLPTWGDKWNRGNGLGPEIFTPENAHAYGEWLGRRYRESGILWILGGDRAIESARHREILEAMAHGLRRGDGGRGLITFHPPGGKTSRDFWPDAPWLDFDMFQSGHCILSLENWYFAGQCQAAKPVRPFLDGEPCYEDHPVMSAEWKPVKPGWRFGVREVRRAAWWSLLSGACGHVYGAQPCWMMWDSRYEPFCDVRINWQAALDFPGAEVMGDIRHIAEKFGFPMEPLPGFVEGSQQGWEWTPLAGRAPSGAILIYSPLPQSLRLRCEHLSAREWTLGQICGQGAAREILRGQRSPGPLAVPQKTVVYDPDALLVLQYAL